MRNLLIAIGLILSAASSILLAQGGLAAIAPASTHYSTADTPIGILIDDPAARAVLDKYVPNFSRSGQNNLIGNVSLKSIQGYGPQVLTDKVLADIDAELVKLTPIKPLPVSRMTTDEARVRPYTLPDPLRLANGQPVREARTWMQRRRPEILAMFETLEFGRAPGRPVGQYFEVFDKGTPALGGKAIRKQVIIHLAKDPKAPAIQLVEYVPAAAKKPVPMMLTIGFTAPSAMIDDPGIRPGTVWDQAKKSRVPATASPMGKFDVGKFLDAGIGVATYYYGDVEPDFPGGYPLGVRGYFSKVDEANLPPDAWGAIGAYAWSLSRVQDYLETDRAVDARRVAINGASRLGKTVLWAAARDQRFAAVIACCSGKIGASIMRRNYGAPIKGTDTGVSDYWMAGNFRQFYDNEDALPMDAHMLLALIAPRAVLLQTGKYDHAADPKGEFLAAVAAGPVYRLLGKQDLGTTAWPPSAPILNDIGYHMNAGGHGMAPGDWDIYLEFLVQHLHPQN